MTRMHLAALGLAGLLGFPCGARAAEAKRPLPPWHEKAGVICHDCHQKEKPTSAAVADESCMVCHGDYPAMAELTKHLPVNPHAPPKPPHAGPFACPECHHQHKPAVVKCLECHPDFKLKPR